jgi:tetratricopeptide (TPR) repeat protein/CHAT domain-containing protein
VRRSVSTAVIILALAVGHAPRLASAASSDSTKASGRGPRAAGLSSQAPSAPQAIKPAVALPPAEADRIFTDLLNRFFRAYAAKDIEGMASLWHPSGPARSRRNIVLVEFDTRQIALAGVVVQNASADPGGGKARAVVDLAVTDSKTGKTRSERRVRDFTFLPDDTGTWRVWNETSPGADLARQLLTLPPDQRDAALAARTELASDDTLSGLTNEAGRLQSQGKSAEVLEVLVLQTRLARALGNQDAVGRSLLQTGSLRMMTGRYAEAGEAFTAAREAYSATGNTEEMAACDANLGNLAYMQGRFAEAAERYDRAYAVFEKLNDDPRMASTLHGIGNATYMQGDFSRALTYYTKALDVLRRTNDKYSQGNVLQALALVHKELGDYASAADSWRQTLALAESGNDRAGVAKAHAGLGDIYRLQGDLARALQHQFKALQAWESLKNAGATATAHYAIGQLYAIQRNFPRALESYDKALALDLSIRDDTATSESGQARELGGMAGAHLAMGRADVARGEYERSLALREKLKDEPGVMWTLAHLGVLHAAEKRPDDASTCYERSLSIAQARLDPNAASTVLALRAQLEFDQGHDEAALESAAKASAVALGIEHFDTVMYAKVVTGRVLQKAAKFDEARSAYLDAVAALARVPTGPAADTFFDDRRAPFVALVDLFASAGNRAEAFRWSERNRLEALADMFGGNGEVIVKGLTPAERDQERAVGKELRALAVRVRRERGREKPDAARLSALQSELAAKDAERDVLRRSLFDKHPGLRDLRAQSDPASPDAAAGIFGTQPGVVLSFVLTEARTWAFAVAKDAAGAWTVQKMVPIEVKAAELAGQVKQFREAIARKEAGAEELAKALFSRLIDPLVPVLEHRTRLVVVPDGFLWSLPFEALERPDGRFLVEDLAVSYAPSLSALAAMSATQGTQPAARTLVSVGQPTLGPAVEERLALVRPSPPAGPAGSKSPREGPEPAESAATGPAASAAPPAAAAPPSTAATPAPPAAPRPADAEGQGMAALFAPASRKLFVGDQARADRIASGVAPGALLHLEVPVVLTEASPLFTTLAFTPTDASDPASALVEAYALMFVGLPAELVLASRVEYGPASGEGDALTVFAWCAFVGGSPTLVLDRWTGASSDPNLAVRFTRAHVAPLAGAARAPRAAESLQKAMKGVLSQPAWRHPFYWAGYFTIGR